uniref:Uncharacterized protein n=1 Tax=Melon chlorotic spot virus TaxID=2479459 RepID=A0A481T0Y6_9VIRU|nr:hypothetical protein [Melon chlorotic spot virus]
MDPAYNKISSMLSDATRNKITRGQTQNLATMSNTNIANIFKDLISYSSPSDDQRQEIVAYANTQLLKKLKITTFPAVDASLIYNNMDLDFLSLENIGNPSLYTTDEVVQIVQYQWITNTTMAVDVNEVVGAFSYAVISVFESA